jgi:heme/copper-type cytochrome/quinol oxidase subunit 1
VVAGQPIPPLSALGEASPGSKVGMDLWLVSMALFVVSSLLGGLNYIATVLNMRTKGMSMTRMPLTIWAFFFTAVLGVLSFPVLFSGFILLIFDRHFGTSFYLSDIYINGQALPNEGGSAILYQHLFWFLGHPEVYIILLPAMGMVRDLISEQPQTNLRLYGHDGIIVCHCYPGLPGMGAPHVCNRIESVPGCLLRTAYIVDCGTISYQGI